MSTAYEFDVLLNVDEDFPGRQQVEPSFSSPRLPSAEASQNASSETGNEHLPSSSNATAQSTYFDQDRLLKLSSLIPDLIADFNRINALHLSDILSYNSNANTLPSSSAKNMIGRVMDCSQRFLDAFQHPSQDQGKAHQSHQHHDEQDMPQPNPSSTGPAYESGFWKPPNEAGAICALQSPASAPKYDNPSSQHSSSQQHARTHIDLPSSLTILTCYIWLLRTYDSIFTKLYTVLEPNLPVTHGSPDTLPSVLPGLWIGGFGLDNNRTIQIEILLQLSSRMIERIESVLGMNLISPCDDGSLDLGLELDKAPHLQPRSPVTPPSLSPSSSLSERSMVFNATATNALMGALQEQSSSTASAEMNVSAGWKPHDLKQTMRRIQDVLGARQV
ncbi:uncharacterized protein BDV14DRAFT_198697 [Aspergillus stella-maris]|uniref:uncharacterized protein n=1 Tax=Aspergillus stella-maris TaxID=1810926 RepID=UPI003CCD7271